MLKPPIGNPFYGTHRGNVTISGDTFFLPEESTILGNIYLKNHSIAMLCGKVLGTVDIEKGSRVDDSRSKETYNISGNMQH